MDYSNGQGSITHPIEENKIIKKSISTENMNAVVLYLIFTETIITHTISRLKNSS